MVQICHHAFFSLFSFISCFLVLPQFLETGKLEKTHWTSTGEAQFWNGKQKYRLQGNYDADARQTVLSDGSGQVHVYLSYLNPETDPGKEGNFSFVCKSMSFSAAPGSSGYLCGEAELKLLWPTPFLLLCSKAMEFSSF